VNERIFELIQSQNGFSGLVWTEQDKQEFAELIVKECIGIVEGYCETSPEIWGLPLEILEHFDMELGEE
jgi:hypothetical protein